MESCYNSISELKIVTFIFEKIPKLLKEAKADKSVLTLKSLEAMAKVADGKSTKIIIPSDLQQIASAGLTISEILKDKSE